MQALAKIDRNRLALIGIALAAVLFLAFNVVVSLTLHSAQIDLTQRKLYTLSEGTKKVLTSLDEPITLRFYFTRALGENYPAHAAYAKRVRELLERYVQISGGKIHLEVHNPEPFSEMEDEAVALGLQGVPYDESGDLGYFGVSGSNSVDGHETIPYLSPEREPFLEYDLTKMVYSLSHLKKPVVGLVSRLPIEGGFAMGARPQPAWAIVNQMRDLFDLRSMPAEFSVVPKEMNVLFIVHPHNFTKDTLYAIDQFVLRGGKVIAFVDPLAETDTPGPGHQPGPSDLSPLLKSWGIKFVKNKIAADLKTARRVNVRDGQGQIALVDYVAWNSLTRDNLNTNDPVIADIRDINLASAGILEPLPGATTKFIPLMRTSKQSEELDVSKLEGQIDVIGLFRDFKPSGKNLVMAARITGPAKSAFPDGPPMDGTGDAAKKGHAERMKSFIAQSTKPINVIVVADTDILQEGNWANLQNVGGQQLMVPYAGNGDFAINAVENLAGGDALLSLRSRGDSKRPFTMVDDIQRKAERQFRTQQERLVKELAVTQKKLETLTDRENVKGDVILSPDEKQTISEFRTKMVHTRRQLRDVQHALRKDIDDLDAWLKFLNIAAIPILLGLAALVIAVVKRMRRAKRPAVTG